MNWRAYLGAAAMLAAMTVAAEASPPPIGLWQGTTSGDYILVKTNGECSASGSVNIAGYCWWMDTATGGVLELTYQWVKGPGHIDWSIRWLNPQSILVNNVETFVRRQ
jgi:hypothetical protein